MATTITDPDSSGEYLRLLAFDTRGVAVGDDLPMDGDDAGEQDYRPRRVDCERENAESRLDDTVDAALSGHLDRAA
ncbi:hypothetical protein [Haloarcula marina]|uniref:hypothetical protein n=1 Tax=Haloarcula marina TaxID=2961574 RepID=UPI0020B89483|nr:hypothetical protein [Halomicroarcula marina]